MKRTIGMWAIAGFLVAGFWAVYAFVGGPLTFTDPVMVWVQLTCPIAFLRYYPLHLSWVLLANTVTYALAGVIVENLRRRLHPAG
jgi:hypothetical protein